jgi:hypothetical protein
MACVRVLFIGEHEGFPKIKKNIKKGNPRGLGLLRVVGGGLLDKEETN